jgi:hypothetical protein
MSTGDQAAPEAAGDATEQADRGGRRGRAAWTAAVVLAAGLVLGGASWRGHAARTFAPAPAGGGAAVLPVASAEQAVLAWRAAGLRGRTLVLFAAYPHFHTTWLEWSRGAPLTDANWLDVAILENVVRRVYWVVPEEGWEAFRRQPRMYSAIDEAPAVPAPTPLFTASGVPLLAVTPRSLPRLDEPVLAFVDAARFPPAEAASILASRRLESDLTVVLARGPGR